MTISEAVQLVLQSSVIANGGETFILNMGKPIKIIDIAKKMISSSGLQIKNNKNKNGDIEIKFIGMKKGEKLKEELLFNGSIESTIHPLINKATEEIIVNEDIIKKIYLLIENARNNNEDTLVLYREIIKHFI